MSGSEVLIIFARSLQPSLADAKLQTHKFYAQCVNCEQWSMHSQSLFNDKCMNKRIWTEDEYNFYSYAVVDIGLLVYS